MDHHMMHTIQTSVMWAAGGLLAYLLFIAAGQIALHRATARAHPALKTTANRTLHVAPSRVAEVTLTSALCVPCARCT